MENPHFFADFRVFGIDPSDGQTILTALLLPFLYRYTFLFLQRVGVNGIPRDTVAAGAAAAAAEEGASGCGEEITCAR
jgi:hypothetical protein